MEKAWFIPPSICLNAGLFPRSALASLAVYSRINVCSLVPDFFPYTRIFNGVLAVSELYTQPLIVLPLRFTHLTGANKIGLFFLMLAPGIKQSVLLEPAPVLDWDPGLVVEVVPPRLKQSRKQKGRVSVALQAMPAMDANPPFEIDAP